MNTTTAGYQLDADAAMARLALARLAERAGGQREAVTHLLATTGPPAPTGLASLDELTARAQLASSTGAWPSPGV